MESWFENNWNRYTGRYINEFSLIRKLIFILPMIFKEWLLNRFIFLLQRYTPEAVHSGSLVYDIKCAFFDFIFLL